MERMSSKERVLRTMSGMEPDTVPIFDFIYSRPLYKEILGHTPEYYNAEDILRCSERIGYDLAVVPFGGVAGLDDPAVEYPEYSDEWGPRYLAKEETWPTGGPVGFPIRSREDLRNYVWPDPKKPERLKEISTGLRLAREYGMALFGSVRGPFSASWLLTGLPEFMLFMFDEPELVDEILTHCTDFFIEGGRRMAEAAVAALVFADAYGSNTGPLVAPERSHRFVFPHTRRMIEAFRRLGVPVVMHSDGNLNLILADLVGMGISAYHPMERASGMKIDEVKRKHGRSITLGGNVNNKTTLVSGTVRDVENEVRECIRKAAPGGGYILASDHSLHDDIPNRNVFALYEAGRRYGSYPIGPEV